MSKVFTITEGLENMGALRTGGQGSVYKGKRIGEIITAVKILPTPIHTENTDDKNYRNFKNEVEKLKKVNEIPNPNVVKIVNSGLTESGSFPFIEMQYIEGPDLEELLQSPHAPIFTIRETKKLAHQLANALAHCHRVGVKHGDIKSNNVKFNTDTGNYILLDFGLAIMSDEQRRSSIQHAGAVEFMAPEQHDGEMFFQTDIYSFGIILYELLAGVVPFPLNNKGEASRNAVMVSHMEKPVPNLLSRRKSNLPDTWSHEVKAREMNIPVWLLEVIKKCLEKNPEKRYANGSDLQEAILHENFDQSKLISSKVVGSGFTLAKTNAEQDATVDSIASKNATSLTGPNVTEKSPDTMEVSKPLFISLILLLVALGTYSAYSLFIANSDQKQIVYEDSTNQNFQDTVGMNLPYQIDPDTTKINPPVKIDTAARQAEVDSLRKEFEQQTGATSVKPATPAIPTENVLEPLVTSNGKQYRLPKGALYFYDEPSADAEKHKVLPLWTIKTKFNVLEEQNGFIQVMHTTTDGEVTKGWLNKNDLRDVQ
ncbi:serine/threonine-protein kinase [Pedobacter sp. JCM 36344]|uniref:serine/threonine-protein kinase n=1 Tax=Pedobacter sp. JCM 36344 TaxID=3374280 RepID=UPI00397B2E39